MRDFFYSKGDIFLAILIILVAAFVIYLRVGVIMDYSASGKSGGSLLPMPPSVSDVIDSVTGAGTAGDAGAGTDGTDQNTAPAATDQGAGQTADATAPDQGAAQDGQAAQPAQTDTPPAAPPAPASVQVVVAAGDAASTIADKLLAAGAISEKQAFLSEVTAQGAESKLKMGTFTIPAGASNADIIKILVG